jgi:hypothetical protein
MICPRALRRRPARTPAAMGSRSRFHAIRAMAAAARFAAMDRGEPSAGERPVPTLA